MHPAPITNMRGYLPFVYTLEFGAWHELLGPASIDIDRRPNGNHVVQLLDVLILEAYATMTYRAPDCLRGIGSMNAVSVAKHKPPGSKHTLVTSLIHSVRRNENVAVGNYLTPVVRLES